MDSHLIAFFIGCAVTCVALFATIIFDVGMDKLAEIYHRLRRRE